MIARSLMTPGHLMIICTTAFLFAVLATPALRRAALGMGIVDRPAVRKFHAQPVPLLGGLGIYGAVIASLLLFPARRELVELTGIIIGASWISFWGLWDDRFGLSPFAKLAAQLAAAVMIMVVGIQVSLPIPGWANIALTLFWVVGITNAFNLLDNMDGLSGGIAAVAAAWVTLLAAINGQYLVAGLAAAVLGACLGFLIYNFNPASIFMGDSGSLFLGFLMAVLGIKLRFPANVNWVTWMVPILVLGVPIFDTSLVVVSRLRRRKNPFTTPGTDHFSHRLNRMGWSRRETVLLIYLAGCALGGVATFVSLASPLGAYLIIATVVVFSVVAIIRLEKPTVAILRPENATDDGDSR